MYKLYFLLGLLIFIGGCSSSSESTMPVNEQVNQRALDSAGAFQSENDTNIFSFDTSGFEGADLLNTPNAPATAPENIGHKLVEAFKAGSFIRLEKYLPDSNLVLQHYIERRRDTSTYKKNTYSEQAKYIKATLKEAYNEVNKQAAQLNVNWQVAKVDSVVTRAQPEGNVQYSLVNTYLTHLNQGYLLNIKAVKIGDNWYLGESLTFRKFK